MYKTYKAEIIVKFLKYFSDALRVNGAVSLFHSVREAPFCFHERKKEPPYNRMKQKSSIKSISKNMELMNKSI